MSKPPVDIMRECFTYRDDALWWKRRPQHHFATNTGCAIFNGRFEGKKATHVGDDGYPRVKLRIDGTVYHLMQHRVVWALVHGAWPPDELDHKNRKPLDRSIANLRQASRLQNLCNRSAHRNSKTGVKGVYPRRNGFCAAIRLNGIKVHLGDFKHLADAAAAYREAAQQLHGEFAYAEK